MGVGEGIRAGTGVGMSDHDLLIELKKDVEYIRSKLTYLCEWENNYDRRLRYIEQRLAYVLGASSVVAVVVSLVVGLLI